MQLLEYTMTLVEQGVKQPTLSCFSMESSSSDLERSLLDEHNKSQDSFPGYVRNSILKDSVQNGFSSQQAVPSAIPHWMSTRKESEVQIGTSTNDGLNTNMVISKPHSLQENLNLHCQISPEPFGTLSIPSTGFEAEKRNNFSMAMQSRADESNSEHLLPKQVLALSVGSKALEALHKEEQKEYAKVDLLSLLLQNQQKQVMPGCPTGLRLGHHDRRNPEVSSWLSKFPFQIGPEADFSQSLEPRKSIHHSQILEPNKEFSLTRDHPSQLANSKNCTGKSNFLIQHSHSPLEAAKSGLPQRTQVGLVSSTSRGALTEKPLSSDVPSLKRDWNATLMQSVKHPQILPDFFTQQKVTTAAKANLMFSNCGSYSETKGKDFFSKDAASRVCKELTNGNKNPSLSHLYRDQQEQACGKDAQEKLSHNSCLQTNMLKVKVEASSEDFDASRCFELPSGESMRSKTCIVGNFEGKFSTAASQAAKQLPCVGLDVNKIVSNLQTTELRLFAECASSQVIGTSCYASASVPPQSSMRPPFHCKGFGKGKTVPEGDWGEFLAGCKVTQPAETRVESMLPFQQRFEQLQEFLRKCDGSDKEYCWQAYHVVSAKSAQNDRTAELESRAIRLSLDEGREMKRAKLLNMVEEVSFPARGAKPVGPGFLSPKGATLLKEES